MEYKGHDVTDTMPKMLYSAQLSITNEEGYKEDPTSFLQEHYVAISNFKYGLKGYSTSKISEIIKTHKSKDRIIRSKLIDVSRRIKLAPKNHFILLILKHGHPYILTFCPIITDDDIGTVIAMIRYDYSMFQRNHAPMEEEAPFIVDRLPEVDFTTVLAGDYQKCKRTGLDYPPCFTCSSTDKKIFTCSICQVAAYCDRECQKKDWKEHKKICKPKQ